MCFVFFLGVGVAAGARLAQREVVATWVAMTFALLGVLEPESVYLIIATTVYGLLDLAARHAHVPAWLAGVLWAAAVVVPRFIPSLGAMSQRPVPPVHIITCAPRMRASRHEPQHWRHELCRARLLQPAAAGGGGRAGVLHGRARRAPVRPRRHHAQV